MRITKEAKELVRTKGTKGLYQVMTTELVSRTSSLKKATDMNTVSRHQGAIEVLESLLKLEDN